MSVLRISLSRRDTKFGFAFGCGQKSDLCDRYFGYSRISRKLWRLLYSIEGHLFENGQRARPLKDFLMSGNILELLLGVEAVGNDVLKPLGSIVCPSLLVRDLNIAGQA